MFQIEVFHWAAIFKMTFISQKFQTTKVKIIKLFFQSGSLKDVYLKFFLRTFFKVRDLTHNVLSLF